MDDFYLFNRALSQSELKKVMYGEGWPYAFSPSPADGAMHLNTGVSLGWSAGKTAASHDVYFSDNFADVNDGTGDAPRGNQALILRYFIAGYTGFAYPEGLVPGTTYYWRIDEVEADDTTIYKGDVWSFWIPPNTAYDPGPADGAKFIDPDVELSWTSGFGANRHTVYFGENFDDVNNASEGPYQPGTTYTPDTLELDKTYYWRVDERDPGGIMYKGEVWSFTTAGTGGGMRADYYRDVNLRNHALMRIDPQINFNWSLSGPDEAVGDDNFSIRWVGELNVPISGTYSFYPTVQGGVRLWVNDRLLIEKWQDFGIDERWQEHMPVEYHRAIYLEAGMYPIVMEFAYRQSFGGGAVVRLAWGSPSMPRQVIPQTALSLPVKANRPSPSNGAVDIRQTASPGWSPGEYAASHEVYFGTDEDAVRNADTASPEYYKGTRNLGFESYDPGKLAWLTTYYWRVDEVNDVNPDSPWVGNIWSFTTADFLIVDDFELYNDLNPNEPGSNRIFLTWLDGYGTTTNGSTVGYSEPDWGAGGHFVETNVVHGGNQSMPYFYVNNFKYSEAVLPLSPPQDWTEEGVEVLSLWFYGDASNAAEQMYVAVNSTGPTVVVDHDNPNAAKIDTWTEWTIDLQVFADQGVNLTNVNSIAIGFGDKNSPQAGGSGMVFFDDIRLYRPAEPTP